MKPRSSEVGAALGLPRLQHRGVVPGKALGAARTGITCCRLAHRSRRAEPGWACGGVRTRPRRTWKRRTALPLEAHFPLNADRPEVERPLTTRPRKRCCNARSVLIGKAKGAAAVGFGALIYRSTTNCIHEPRAINHTQSRCLTSIPQVSLKHRLQSDFLCKRYQASEAPQDATRKSMPRHVPPIACGYT